VDVQTAICWIDTFVRDRYNGLMLDHTMTDREDVPSMTDSGNAVDTGNAVMHISTLEEIAIKLIEACAEQNEPITIPEAVRRTVDRHYPLDADRYQAWGMWIERLENSASSTARSRSGSVYMNSVVRSVYRLEAAPGSGAYSSRPGAAVEPRK
jgi:hypothetical protein